MSTQFRYLFSPLKIGTMTVRNRILQTAHHKAWEDTITVDDGCLTTERTAYYCAERAKGGAGLMVMGYQAVHPNTCGLINPIPEAWRQENIPRYRLITDMVHQYGGAIANQLVHNGRLASHESPSDPRVIWAPSAIWGMCPSATVAKAMTHEEIREVIEYFRRSAANSREAGFDAVELHCASGYLPQQFLSQVTNKRTDEYGGSLENRMRFTLELIEAVREELGKDYTLGIRIAVDEFVNGGLTLDPMKTVCKTYADTGKLDFLDVTQGASFPQTFTSHAFGPGITMPPGVFVPLAAAIKMVVRNIPIFCVGKINDPVMAEKVLADGSADMVGMTRALICDPELPNKTREGRLDDIRHCMACNQGCRGRRQGTGGTGGVACVQNPAAGRERRLGIGTLQSAGTRKRVVVVGGGPGGLKAAEIAARRGHDVTLYEKHSELGGQLRLAAKTPLLVEVSESIRHLSIQAKKLGVKINTGVEATPELVLAQKPDAVVIATGSRPIKTIWDPVQLIQRTVPGVEQDNVVFVADVLEGKVKVGQKVVVADGENHYRSISVADYLAQQGKQVEIVTPSPSAIGPYYTHQFIGDAEKMVIADRFRAKGVKVTPLTVIKEISGDTLTVFGVHSPNVDRKITGIDTIIWITGEEANEELYLALKDKVKEPYRVGDCLAPRYMQHAFFEGEMVGRQL